MNPWDSVVGIFQDLATAGGRIITDLWITIRMAIWGAGLWVFRMVLQIGEWLMTPSLAATTADGSPNALTYTYGITLWFALMLALILTMVQLIVALIRRDGRSLGMLLLGAAQFLLASSLMFSYAAAVVAAVGGINQALMRELLGVKSMQDLQLPGFDIAEAAVSGMVATVLLLLGLVLWVAALSHVVVLLGRSVALIVLTATAPIAAAGLIYEPLKVWFWKTLRWFHAAAFAPLLMTLMLGIGIQVANGVAFRVEDDAQKAAAAAIPAVVMILVASWSPLALFRLLAFVDPGTTSGASFRAALQPADSTGQGLGRLHTNLTHHLAEKTTSGGSSTGDSPVEAAPPHAPLLHTPAPSPAALRRAGPKPDHRPQRPAKQGPPVVAGFRLVLQAVWLRWVCWPVLPRWWRASRKRAPTPPGLWPTLPAAWDRATRRIPTTPPATSTAHPTKV